MQMIKLGDESSRLQSWYGTDRAISVSKTASIEELSQALTSRLVLSEDFPHMDKYPLAVLAMHVSLKDNFISKSSYYRLITPIERQKRQENHG